MGYKVIFKDGSSETVDDATSMTQDGSGTKLFNADGDVVAAFRDGIVDRVSRSTNKVEEPSKDEADQ